MNIISYNVNGIRAALKKGFADWLKIESPDIICIQETKAHKNQVDTNVFEYLGYNQYWFSAEKKGYSSVAIFSKIKPNEVIYGIDNPKFDIEGRFLRLNFDNFTIISSYFPSGTTGTIRQDYKMEYLAEVQKYVNNLKDKNIIISGDYNICHKPIDINHPERHKNTSGFLPEEREWMTNFLESGFIDSFRHFNQEPKKYSWWSYRQNSREKNLGWRIDYHMVSNSLKDKLISVDILKDIVHSDHCPVKLEIDI
ncbi:MAG: exodeoxyribonuclease III [Bacteroidetes bacterium]|nr:MAG: exodeoxyribonuclease III [Bacteroidota bacterium]